MAQLAAVFWRDIPVQVVARAGRTTARRELPPRFAAAVDQAAMRAGLTGTDAYLDEWRRADPIACGDDLGAEAAAAAAALEAAYPPQRLAALVHALGRDQAPPPDR